MLFATSGRRVILTVALFALLTESALAIDPAAIEQEIKVRKLSGAASEVHLLNAPPERFAVWRQGAEAGDPACEWLIGRCHDFGFTVPKDPAEALSWHRKAAERGYARAQLSLGHKLAAGRSVPKDLEGAFRLYQQAAEQPICPEAYEWVILAYNRGYGVPKDPAKVKSELAPRAIAAYQALAEKGYAGAQMRLGRIFTSGTWGTPVDLDKGLAYYRQGLEQGHVYCQTNLGEAYIHGQLGLTKDVARGVGLMRLAVAQGEPIARRNLVEMYLDGIMPDPDQGEADRLFRAEAPKLRADAETEPGAMYRLAQMSEQGAGLPRDDAEAIALYRKAAEAGSAPAALALADRLETGRGVPKDLAEAARLRDKAKGPSSP